MDVVQAYGNCPQYIRRRHINHQNAAAATDFPIRRGVDVATDDIELIRSADTFFLGTTHLERGNDASHRGGPADFVYADHETVEWPDYPGNNMFNSFGNLAVDPTAALLFIDFRSGRTLQLSGSARRVDVPAADGDTGAMNNLGNVLARSDPPDLAAARGLWDRRSRLHSRGFNGRV